MAAPTSARIHVGMVHAVRTVTVETANCSLRVARTTIKSPGT